MSSVFNAVVLSSASTLLEINNRSFSVGSLLKLLILSSNLVIKAAIFIVISYAPVGFSRYMMLFKSTVSK
jgi:hypothetical protein